MIEVFLPYAQNSETGETLYTQLERGGFKMLAAPDGDKQT